MEQMGPLGAAPSTQRAYVCARARALGHPWRLPVCRVGQRRLSARRRSRSCGRWGGRWGWGGAGRTLRPELWAWRSCVWGLCLGWPGFPEAWEPLGGGLRGARGHSQGTFRGYCCSVAKSSLTLCDPTDCCTPGLPVHHQLPELAQTHVH